jgi:hypothetical protein
LFKEPFGSNVYFGCCEVNTAPGDQDIDCLRCNSTVGLRHVGKVLAPYVSGLDWVPIRKQKNIITWQELVTLAKDEKSYSTKNKNRKTNRHNISDVSGDDKENIVPTKKGTRPNTLVATDTDDVLAEQTPSKSRWSRSIRNRKQNLRYNVDAYYENFDLNI